MKNLIALLLAPLLLVVASCATAEFATANKHSAPSISGSTMLVYSFLDVREDDLGAQMVAAVNRQLAARLQENQVSAELITYQQTSAGRYTARSGSVMIPVERIVFENRAREREIGARYRLIVIPSQMTIYGAAQDYEVRWELMDVETDEVVWSTVMRGGRTIWWSSNEDAEGRAATFVNGVIAEMTSSGLFRSGGAGI